MAEAANVGAPRGNQTAVPKKQGPDHIEYVNATGSWIPRPTITTDPAKSKLAPTWSQGKEKMTACFGCGQFGHIRKFCPAEEYAWTNIYANAAKVGEKYHPGWVVTAEVNGQRKRALIDTGCTRSLVRELEGPRLGETVVVRCIHGDAKEYDTARANVTIGTQEAILEVGVVPGLTREMLLGRDWPGLEDLARQAEDGFVGEKDRGEGEGEVMQLSRDQLRGLQQDDPSLRPCIQKAFPEGDIPVNGEGFEVRQGLLYHIRRGEQGEETALVVPEHLRGWVMHWAHDLPVAGHLATQKTLARIRQRFFWPNMVKHVEYCKSCPE